ncbi:stage II sporulation protein M [Nocardioides marmorisolisilvae]|uniref:Stage II sporulation protein M n=1 Tax=Nocardioides marmorisolisilvae TaxID=1542737 RepID=A0A3N0DZI9_9ACTN|nr:stage II sporulation protein M [Nocardioides marmorisolisilvae]RNL81035.1 stage II sporulation protein M [Nocardioides marmorisolisilvae]
MDLDAFVLAHQPAWVRLEQLSKRVRLSGTESDELSELYQRVATHLSVIRSGAPDAAVIGYLSNLLARARTRSGGARVLTRAVLAEVVARQVPAALYRTRRWWMTLMLGSYALVAVMIAWLLAHPQVESTMMSPAQVNQLVNNDFEGYYSESASSHFAAEVWTHNALVTAGCVALGVFGLPVLYLVWQNLLNLAVIGSIMIRHGRTAVFFGMITPHGLLELTAVFVAAGTGLRLMWSWVAPGQQSRARALAAEGRAAGGIVLALAVVLLVTGIIEGFVTPSGLPTWSRISIGVVAEAAFLTYVFVLGKRAVRAGHTGDIAAHLREDRLLTAG